MVVFEKLVDFILNKLFSLIPKQYLLHSLSILLGITLIIIVSIKVPIMLNHSFTKNTEDLLLKKNLMAELAKDDNEIVATMHLQSIDLVDNKIICNQKFTQRNYNYFFYGFLAAAGLIYWGVWGIGNTHRKIKIRSKTEKELKGYSHL